MTTKPMEDELLLDDDLSAAANGAAASLLGLLYQQPAVWSAVTLVATELPMTMHRSMFEALQELRRRDVDPEPALVREELQRAGVEISDFLLRGLTTGSGGKASLPEYERIIRRYDSVRRLRQLRSMLDGHIEAGDGDAGWSVVNETLANGPKHRAGSEAMKPVIWRVVEKLETPDPWVATGIERLDEMLDGGVRPGEVMVIGARPSVGKSAIALQLILEAAWAGVGVGLWSLEMSREQWVRRAVAQSTGVSMRKLRRGELEPDEYARIATAMTGLAALPIHMADATDTTPAGWRLEASRLVREEGVGLLVIDYVQLMQPDHAARNREQEVARISRTLKTTSLQLEVPTIALAQLSRDAENRVPTLAHLRESGAIEQDADEVLFLHRERDEDSQSLKAETLGILAKNRDGATGAFPLVFDPLTYTFGRSRSDAWQSQADERHGRATRYER